MGRNMRAGKKPKKAGAGNMKQQMAQMQAVQRQMEQLQSEISEMETTATSGGGAVSVTVNGDKEIKSITLQPEVVDPDDIEMLQDLVISAVNECLHTIEDTTNQELDAITNGMNIPGIG